MDELSRLNNLIKPCGNNQFVIEKGFVPNMRVEGTYYANSELQDAPIQEMQQYCNSNGTGGFLPALMQVSNVASLPGIVGRSVGLPDLHSGYGFAIGNVAAFDMNNPEAVVSPGGVGFDINCGVRLVRTNLLYDQIKDEQEKLCQKLFDFIPVGVGSKGVLPTSSSALDTVLELGLDWSIREGYAWSEDKEHCEEYGRMLTADASKVSNRAKKRGRPQLGTLGAGNHYAEIQIVEEIYDRYAAGVMGVHEENQVLIMIHSGSRGLGHQVASDALQSMENNCHKFNIPLNDRQLACAPISSQEGSDYLASMAAAANYAFVNRASMTFLARQAFANVLEMTPDDLDMGLIYDVSHNIAKREFHEVDGRAMELLVHRKGSTRAFPPFHPLIPADYQVIGQPVLIGGTMGTCSYVLTGTEKAMRDTFASTCHGAGRAVSRSKARRVNAYGDILDDLAKKHISIRVASPKLIMEEAADAYKDVTQVVDTCHQAGISNKVFKLKPIAVIKG